MGFILTATTLEMPHNYTARWYQEPFLHAMETERLKRAVCVWHRRAGKDKTFMNYLVPQMLQRIGAYYYYFPTAAMGRDILWDGMDRESFKFMDHFPDMLVARKNESEMKVELKNGSIFKIRGTDKREPIGVNPVGCVFSEYSRQNPKGGWDLVRPILAENEGWAVFNFTPRGKNHAYRLWKMARGNPKWFCEILKADETNAISAQAIQDERDSGMSEELIQQEFYCSFDIGQEGSYYGRLMAKLWSEKKIGNVPCDESAKVYTFWDLGIGDSTVIWFAQFIHKEIHIIDYYENHGEALAHYAKVLQDKPYIYAEHFAPHDIEGRSLQTGLTTLMVAKQLGIKFNVLPPDRIEDGIEAARWTLNRCWFDKTKCEQGIDALENYHAEYDDKREDFKPRPEHDWSSHGADAFRYLAMAYRHYLMINGQHIGSSIPERAFNAKHGQGGYNPLWSGLRRKRA